MRDLVLERVEQLRLGFVRRHAGRALEAIADFLGSVFEIAFATLELTLHGRDLMFARIERFDAAVERFLALREAVLRGTHFAQALLALGLCFLLQPEGFVLRFDDGLAAQRFGLSFRIGHHRFGFLRRTFRGRIDQVPRDDEAEGDADDCSDDEPDELGHTLPLSFQFPIERSVQYKGIKNPG